MTLKPCTVAGCSKPHRAHGWCQMHYNRWRRNGDPLVVTRDWGHNKRAESVSYGGAHYRVRSAKGRAAEHLCAHCSGPAAHWAYDGSDREVVMSHLGMPYTLDPDHYVPLCQPCHRRHDGRRNPSRDVLGRWAS